MKTILLPWRTTRTWHTLNFLGLNLFAWIGFVPLLALFIVSLVLLIAYPLATPFIWLAFLTATGLGDLERLRVGALLDVHIEPPHAPLHAGSWWNRIAQRVSSASRWREFAYVLFLPIFGTLLALVALALWSGALVLIGLPVFAASLPGGSAEFGLFSIGAGLSAWCACLVGVVVFVVVAPWTTLGCGWASGWLARVCLGPSLDTALREEVQSLQISRSAAVDSAETERRRIERDLHDGAQQRLVALAMDLGRAETQFEQNPEAARALLASARMEATAALTELRDLVRGVHPAILSDRGLDAALSAVIARSPVPVELSVRIVERPSAAVESAAYFVVTEALMNVIKHAHATRVHIDIARNGNRLAIGVNDDGVGGADSAKGSGLLGLQERVTALGGWIHVISPQGGPTSIMVELSCES